ncbi:hypothetical protein BFP72_08405 [Reichenbachiella sp. 5M10]|nr:hypothetical protein BFP72_08405 [Reichenbachiella sp. 5M10]
MVACDKEENLFETTTGTATIEGKVEFDEDQTDGTTEYSPAVGAKIKVTYESDDLSYTGSNGVSVTKVIDLEVDADGRFTAEVPAISNNVTYTVKPLDYLTDYKGYDGSTTTNKQGYFTAGDRTVSMTEGEVKYITIQYGFGADF